MKITEFLRINKVKIVVKIEETYDDSGTGIRRIRASMQENRFTNDYKLEVFTNDQGKRKRPGGEGVTAAEAIDDMFNGLLAIRKKYPNHVLSTIAAHCYVDINGNYVEAIYYKIPESFENDLTLL